MPQKMQKMTEYSYATVNLFQIIRKFVCLPYFVYICGPSERRAPGPVCS